MHLVGPALVDVQLRDLVLILHFQHVGHRGFPGIRYALLVRCANQAHVETGTAAHRGNVDNLNAITVQMIAHKARKQMLKGVDPSFRHDFFVRYAKTQVKNRDRVAVRGVHFLRHANGWGFHTGMVNCEAI